jgi:hypothetical protein
MQKDCPGIQGLLQILGWGMGASKVFTRIEKYHTTLRQTSMLRALLISVREAFDHVHVYASDHVAADCCNS